jgi:hypothetical protein
MSCIVHGPDDLRVEPIEVGDLTPDRVRIAVASNSFPRSSTALK